MSKTHKKCKKHRSAVYIANTNTLTYKLIQSQSAFQLFYKRFHLFHNSHSCSILCCHSPPYSIFDILISLSLHLSAFYTYNFANVHRHFLSPGGLFLYRSPPIVFVLLSYFLNSLFAGSGNVSLWQRAPSKTVVQPSVVGILCTFRGLGVFFLLLLLLLFSLSSLPTRSLSYSTEFVLQKQSWSLDNLPNVTSETHV